MSLGAPPPVVSTLALSAAFTVDGVALAGTLQDGVFRSADGGRSWTPWNFALLDTRVLAVELLPGDLGQIVLAGTETGLFKSRTGGRSWEEVDLPEGHGAVHCIAATSMSVGGHHIAIGTDGGLLLSGDGGASWSRTDSAEPAAAVESIVVNEHDGSASLTLVGDGRLYTSADGGGAWVERSPATDYDGQITVVHKQANADGALVGRSDGSVALMSESTTLQGD